MTVNMLDKALELAANGFAVFPLQPRSKLPYPGTRGFLDATTDPEIIRRMFSVPGAENSNIGLRPAPGVIVVDVDRRHGGLEALDTLRAQGKELHETLTVRTGDGGMHAFYTGPDLAWSKEIVHGIDLKADNAYLVAAGSTHPNGGEYAWIDVRPMAPAPPWLVALGRPKNDPVTVTVIDEGESESLPEETIAATASAFEPGFKEGVKHHVAFNGGAWLRSRGFNQSDIARVFELLPSKEPRARVRDALAGYKATGTTGWTELQKLLGEGPAAALDSATPNPKREAERASTAALAQAMAASAVVSPPVQPLTFAAPSAAANADPLASLGVVRDLSKKPEPLNYVIPELELAPGRVSMVAGYSNSGKTTIVQALAFAAAMALLVWGRFFARHCRVLHLDYEAGDVVLENYARLANAHGVPLAAMSQQITVLDARTPLTAPTFEAELTAAIQRGSYGLVIVDVLRAAAGGLDENTAEIAGPLYMLGRVSKATGAAIIVLHHERKPDGDKRSAAEHMISGHNAIHGALQVALSLIREETSGLVAVRPSKRIRKGFEPFSLRFVDVGDPAAGHALEGELGATLANANAPSWGLRVEVAPTSAAAISTPEQTKERGIREAGERILAFLRERAADGQQVRLDVIKTEVVAKDSYKLAALERLTLEGKVAANFGKPRTYSLAANAIPAYAPGTFAPPVSVRERVPRPADPSMEENIEAMREEMTRRKAGAQ